MFFLITLEKFLMRNKPLISIIIPTYNGSQTVLRAINSALNQTYQNIEIIVVDDKSTDNTVEIVKKVKDKRVKLLVHSENRYGSAARNTGMKASKGDYIALLDDDDEFMLDRIEKLYPRINSEYLAVTSDYLLYESGSWRRVSKNQDKQTVSDFLLINSTIGGCSIMIDRRILKLVGYFDETFIRHQDIEYVLRIASKTKIAVVNEPLTKIYGHPGTPDSQKFLEIKEHFLKTFKREIDNLNVDIKNKVYAKHWLQVSRIFSQDGDIKNTVKYLVKSLRYSIIKSDITKILPKETYLLLPFYLLKSWIFGKRKWTK